MEDLSFAPPVPFQVKIFVQIIYKNLSAEGRRRNCGLLSTPDLPFVRLRKAFWFVRESATEYPIVKGVPCFVHDSGYSASFGEHWNRFSRTQLDEYNRMSLSRQQFVFWYEVAPRGFERDRRMLAVGCGMSQFTQILLDAGAHVRSVGISTAVDTCCQNHGDASPASGSKPTPTDCRFVLVPLISYSAMT